MRCGVQQRLIPSTDGRGYWQCSEEAAFVVTLEEFNSIMMRGPFYLCAFHADQNKKLAVRATPL